MKRPAAVRRSKPREASHWPRVRELVRPHRARIAALGLSSFVGGLVEAAFLVIVTRTALAIADGRDQTGLLGGRSLSIGGAIGVAGLLLVARLVLALSTVLWSTGLTVQVSTALRQRLADAFLHASWATQQAEPAGRLQQLVAGFTGSAAGVVASFTSTVSAALSLAALMLGALLVDPLATLSVAVALVVLGGVLAPIRRRIRARARALTEVQVEFSSAVAELGALGLEMQTFGVTDRFSDRIGELSDRLALTQRRADVLRQSLSPVYSSLSYGALLAGLGTATLVGAGQLSSLGAVMLVMLRSLSYGQQLQVASGGLMTSLPALERVDETLALYESNPATGGRIQPAELGSIVATDVSFEYQEQSPVLHDVSFHIESGEIIGVIGPSGAGKSTLVQLLLGVRDPTTGSLEINGVDLRQVDRTWWSQRVAFVAQDALLFTGTVAENARFFRAGINDEAVRHAAKQANLLAEIEALSDGFDTHLGERASHLSGGQRQRLSITRALAGRPELLILDEPTSALDVRSEALIRDTVTDLRGDVTVVIIAHRMSTLEMCDKLMVIEGGRLSAFDDPASLQSSSEFYKHALQVSGIERR